VLVDAIRINQQEAIHDTITRAKPQQERSHCIAKGVRKAPQCNQLATSFVPYGALPRTVQHGIAGQGGSRMKQLHASIHSLVNDYTVKLYRVESFNHRTTPLITWQVWIESDTIKSCVRECNTKREAITWVSIYKQPAKAHA
jgi:hypothetical protein